jgi:uncharacterized protein (DUF924 family)
MNYKNILDFWFDELPSDDWFIKSDALDLKMVEKFIVIHSEAINGELSVWRNSSHGRLAEILLIDQFSRTIYRDDPKAYASDALALALAQELIAANMHIDFDVAQKQFLYMPFMNSESKSIHSIAVKLFSETGLEHSLKNELASQKIINRFERYPERNKILGRQNTAEEEAYLKNKITNEQSESLLGLNTSSIFL